MPNALINFLILVNTFLFSCLRNMHQQRSESNMFDWDKEKKVIANLPSEIHILPGNNNKSDSSEKQTLQVIAKQVKSILIELTATPSVFKSVLTLKKAILKLVKNIHIAGEIDEEIKDTVTVNLKIDSPLTKRKSLEFLIQLNLPLINYCCCHLFSRTCFVTRHKFHSDNLFFGWWICTKFTKGWRENECRNIQERGERC